MRDDMSIVKLPFTGGVSHRDNPSFGIDEKNYLGTSREIDAHFLFDVQSPIARRLHFDHSIRCHQRFFSDFQNFIRQSFVREKRYIGHQGATHFTRWLDAKTPLGSSKAGAR